MTKLLTPSEVRDGVRLEYLDTVPPMRAIGAWERDSLGCVRRLHAERAFDAIHSQSFCGLHLIGALPGVGVTASLHGTHWDELRTRAGLVRESLPGQPVAGANVGGIDGRKGGVAQQFPVDVVARADAGDVAQDVVLGAGAAGAVRVGGVGGDHADGAAGVEDKDARRGHSTLRVREFGCAAAGGGCRFVCRWGQSRVS